jgi:hypothetical protein
MKKLFVLSIIMITGITLFAGGFGRGGSRSGSRGGCNSGEYLTQYIESIPASDVNDTEKAALIHMVEEEKLARDVYVALFEKWGLRVFDNISKSEQTHMDAIAYLLTRYEIESPVVDEPGKFTNAELQGLYTQLVEKGSLSIDDALYVGATVEDLDIKDLQTDLAATDSADIKTVFQNLMKGSRNHLRAFVSFLAANNVEYVAGFLTQEEVDAIVSSDRERGLIDADGNAVFSPLGSGRGRGQGRF